MLLYVTVASADALPCAAFCFFDMLDDSCSWKDQTGWFRQKLLFNAGYGICLNRVSKPSRMRPVQDYGLRDVKFA